MSQDITLEKSLQAYRVISAPSKYTIKTRWLEELPGPSLFDIENPVDFRFAYKQMKKRWAETELTISPNIRVLSGTQCSKANVGDVIDILTNPDYASTEKHWRQSVFSHYNGIRYGGDDAYKNWSGFQIIDIDVKDEEISNKLKPIIFNALYKCNWFIGVTLSSSRRGLHVYTYIELPKEGMDELYKKKILYMTNFRHKFSFVYVACLNAIETLGITKDDIIKWLDLAMDKPAQGGIIGYDPHPLINTRFFCDQIYMCFDNVEDLGHPDIDWVTNPDLRKIFQIWENGLEERPTVELVNRLEKGDDNIDWSTVPKMHYKHEDRWKLANTLVNIYGPTQGYIYLRSICSSHTSDHELRALCQTAHRQKKPIDPWAVQRLNRNHKFNIKLAVIDESVDEDAVMKSMAKLNNPNNLVQAKYYYQHHINEHQYLGNIIPDIMREIGQVTLLEAGPGLGKTEMVKSIATMNKKIMMVMPFTSTIKSKVEQEEGWYYSYGNRHPRLDVEKGLALTLDKFSRLDVASIKEAGFDYIFIDESHLLFMSEYRSVMSRVITMVRFLEVPVIFMSGTPTGELIFFPNITHIHVIKTETRKKECQICMVDDTSSLIYHICRAMANDINAGRRILFPSNEGILYSQKIKAGVQYFLQVDHQNFNEINFEYYKKSQLGEPFMDEINFNKTIRDIDILMCTSYLSVGVDIKDKLDFSVYFADICTAAECDQWTNRLRDNNLYIKVFVAKNDADGNSRNINVCRPANFKLDNEEIKDMHSMIRICNATLERNPLSRKYNPLVTSIVTNNQYIIFNKETSKYSLDEQAYKIVMFERKYREYMQQLPVFMRGMQQYGYQVSAKDLGAFGITGSEIFRDLKNMIKLANDNQINLNTLHIEELLDLMTDDRLDIYRETMAGRYELRKANEWREDAQNNRIYVKSIEVFEKVVPIFLSLKKMFDNSDVVEIFHYCKRKNGSFNFAAINRFRSLVNLISADKHLKLDRPIQNFMKLAYEISDRKKIRQGELDNIIDAFVLKYCMNESAGAVRIDRSELFKKRAKKHFTNLFKCLVNCSRPSKKGGEIEMERVEILWQTREEKFLEPNKNIYILEDFMDTIVRKEEITMGLVDAPEPIDIKMNDLVEMIDTEDYSS